MLRCKTQNPSVIPTLNIFSGQKFEVYYFYQLLPLKAIILTASWANKAIRVRSASREPVLPALPTCVKNTTEAMPAEAFSFTHLLQAKWHSLCLLLYTGLFDENDSTNLIQNSYSKVTASASVCLKVSREKQKREKAEDSCKVHIQVQSNFSVEWEDETVLTSTSLSHLGLLQHSDSIPDREVCEWLLPPEVPNLLLDCSREAVKLLAGITGVNWEGSRPWEENKVKIKCWYK